MGVLFFFILDANFGFVGRWWRIY